MYESKVWDRSVDLFMDAEGLLVTITRVSGRLEKDSDDIRCNVENLDGNEAIVANLIEESHAIVASIRSHLTALRFNFNKPEKLNFNGLEDIDLRPSQQTAVY